VCVHLMFIPLVYVVLFAKALLGRPMSSPFSDVQFIFKFASSVTVLQFMALEMNILKKTNRSFLLQLLCVTFSQHKLILVTRAPDCPLFGKYSKSYPSKRPWRPIGL
jgi:hypothetical protein